MLILINIHEYRNYLSAYANIIHLDKRYMTRNSRGTSMKSQLQSIISYVMIFSSVVYYFFFTILLKGCRYPFK